MSSKCRAVDLDQTREFERPKCVKSPLVAIKLIAGAITNSRLLGLSPSVATIDDERSPSDVTGQLHRMTFAPERVTFL